MERRVALELLGLDPDEPLAYDRVRRAYLRRLRAHPPERDPDGFRRLREAFELLEPAARMAEHMAEAVHHHERWAAPASEADVPAPERVAPLRGGTRTPIPVVMFSPPDPPAAQAPPAAPDKPDDKPDAAPTTAAAPVATREPDARDGRANGWTDEVDTDEDIEVPDEPWIDVRREAAPPVPPIPPVPPVPPRPPVVPGSIHQPDEPPTLREFTDELLVLLERGRLDAALGLADRWHHSALDDHREVSAHVAWRWALTRELLDVAAALPDPLLRAIAHGIAGDELASASRAAELYQTAHPSRASDLAVHLAKRAPNLHKMLGGQLQPREQHQAAMRAQRSGSSRAPIWVAVVIASALVRAAATCDRKPDPAHQLDHIQVPSFQWNGSQRAPTFDPMTELKPDPKLDPEPSMKLDLDGKLAPEPSLKLDPELLRLRRPTVQPPPSPP